jgi:hypothetical protein
MDRNESSGTEARTSMREQDNVMATGREDQSHETDPFEQHTKIKFEEQSGKPATENPWAC